MYTTIGEMFCNIWGCPDARDSFPLQLRGVCVRALKCFLKVSPTLQIRWLEWAFRSIKLKINVGFRRKWRFTFSRETVACDRFSYRFNMHLARAQRYSAAPWQTVWMFRFTLFALVADARADCICVVDTYYTLFNTKVSSDLENGAMGEWERQAGREREKERKKAWNWMLYKVIDLQGMYKHKHT